MRWIGTTVEHMRLRYDSNLCFTNFIQLGECYYWVFFFFFRNEKCGDSFSSMGEDFRFVQNMRRRSERFEAAAPYIMQQQTIFFFITNQQHKEKLMSAIVVSQTLLSWSWLCGVLCVCVCCCSSTLFCIFINKTGAYRSQQLRCLASGHTQFRLLYIYVSLTESSMHWKYLLK